MVVVRSCSPWEGTLLRIGRMGAWLAVGSWFSTKFVIFVVFIKQTREVGGDRAAAGDGRGAVCTPRGSDGRGTCRRGRNRSSPVGSSTEKVLCWAQTLAQATEGKIIPLYGKMTCKQKVQVGEGERELIETDKQETKVVEMRTGYLAL